jgi:hypothetical protein
MHLVIISSEACWLFYGMIILILLSFGLFFHFSVNAGKFSRAILFALWGSLLTSGLSYLCFQSLAPADGIFLSRDQSWSQNVVDTAPISAGLLSMPISFIGSFFIPYRSNKKARHIQPD